MFRRYGFAGILLILFVEVNFFLNIQPFANLAFPIVWLGYILTVDALIYTVRGNSLISNRISQFLGMVLLSVLFWWVFEFVNIKLQNWSYTGLEGLGVWKDLVIALSYSTVLPALFETVELIESVNLFDRTRLQKEHKITKDLLNLLMWLGVISFILPIILPMYAFPLVWICFFLILDPINYIHKQPSIIGHLKDRKLEIPLSLLLAGIIMGFLWEFWNYWAPLKWTYSIPFIGFFKIFEMPLLGYIGYFPFAFELYSMYWFARGLFIHKEHLLSD